MNSPKAPESSAGIDHLNQSQFRIALTLILSLSVFGDALAQNPEKEKSPQEIAIFVPQAMKSLLKKVNRADNDGSTRFTNGEKEKVLRWELFRIMVQTLGIENQRDQRRIKKAMAEGFIHFDFYVEYDGRLGLRHFDKDQHKAVQLTPQYRSTERRLSEEREKKYETNRLKYEATYVKIRGRMNARRARVSRRR